MSICLRDRIFLIYNIIIGITVIRINHHFHRIPYVLERRLDNVVYRLGFASSRTQGRQMVRHSLVTINGHKVNIPSYQVKVGDIVSLKEKQQKSELVADNLQGAARRGVPSWLELDAKAFKGTVKALPNRDEITLPIQEQLIVELYSK